MGGFFMASKGQNFIKYDPILKETILKEYFNGNAGAKSLAKKYGIPFHTIDNWIYKIKHGKNPLIDTRATNSGRKSGMEIDYKERYEILKKFQVFLKARREKK